ncbi:hypothetical protein LTR93_001105 [Exophiala xenobiotica]|nr:hypothetical protein LTR93_001105 [Exophiala xenobiotica]
MASATHFALSVNELGNFDTEPKKELTATNKAEKLLQENLDKIDMMFMDVRHSEWWLRAQIQTQSSESMPSYQVLIIGFSDHIAHQVLATYALGASPDQMQSTYDRICTYMEPLKPINQTVLKALKDKTTFKDYLDDPIQYSNYQAYFQNELDTKGVKSALGEYLFANDEQC